MSMNFLGHFYYFLPTWSSPIPTRFGSLLNGFGIPHHHHELLNILKVLEGPFLSYLFVWFWYDLHINSMNDLQLLPPPGRIFNALECIANWTEWTGAQIYNRLIEWPAQMLGIRNINISEILRYTQLVLNSLLPIRMFASSSKVSQETLDWINYGTFRLAIVIFVFDSVLLSKFFSFLMARFIRYVNDRFFRWIWLLNFS